MLTKYKLIFCLCMTAVLLVFYIFSEKETILSAKNSPSPVFTKRQIVGSIELRDNDDTVAAILILPKSFLPALKRFSNSKLAKNIKILPAQIQLKDGEMMAAVPKNLYENQRDRRVIPGDDFTDKTPKSGIEIPPGKKEGIVAISFLYLLANIHKSRLHR